MATLLNQQATFSNAHTPPAVLTSMREARTAIQRLKGVLRAWNVPVEDLPTLWQAALAAAAKGEWAHAERLFAQVAALKPQYEDVQTRWAEARVRATLAASRADDDWETVLAALANAPLDFADPQGHRTWAEARQRRDQRYEAALKAAASSQWQAAVPYLVALLAEAPDDQASSTWLAHFPPLQAEVARRQRWLPTMVKVPAGPFLMGSSSADQHAESDEKPQHTLSLPDYWIGKTPITNAQFRPFVEGDGYTNQAYWTAAGWQWREGEKLVKPLYWDDAKWNGADYPVIGVSWFEAVAYCRWLSAQTGITFCLPSEAEWEKAARGADGRIYPWGNPWETGRCNSEEANIQGTTPVGQYPSGASPYGALDMAGNVWEWCATKWGKPYPHQVEDEWQAVYVEADQNRVLRGGSWYVDRTFVRGASRLNLNPRDRYNFKGLRIAQLGGFQGRKGDGEPGVTVMWKGFQRLVDIAAMYRIMHQDAVATPSHARFAPG